MSGSDIRTARILLRTRALRQARRRRADLALAAVCCALGAGLTGLFRVTAAAGGPGHAPGMFGSILLFGDAGGYVLAGVLAFAAGVGVTVSCIRYRNGQGKSRPQRDAETGETKKDRD